MRKVKSLLVSLAIIASLGLFFHPAQVRADGGGPQNTSNSQSSGGSSPTLLQVLWMIIRAAGG